MMFSLLLLCFQAIVISVSSGSRVEGYDLYNAKTGNLIRPLTAYDVITESEPLAIIARAPGAKSVTFISPSFRLDSKPPFSLSEENPGATFKPIHFKSGINEINALSDRDASDQNLRIGVQFLPSFPKLGPLPSSAVPKPLPQGDLSIPRIKPSCKRDGPPTVSVEEIEEGGTVFTPNEIEVRFSTQWCDEDPVRHRVIRWSRSRKGKVRTGVLLQRIETDHGSLSHITLNSKCKSLFFFVEACVLKPGPEGELCSTSQIKWLRPLVSPEAGLKWRPPFELKLAPGDSAKLTTVSTETNADNINDARVWHGRPEFLIRGVFESKNGKQAFTPWTRNKSVTTKVPLREGGVTMKDNQSLFYGSYSTTSCRSSTGSWKGLFETKILVSKKHKSLERQDTKLPEFLQPKYPPTPLNESVEITVEASNSGGGLRAGGKPVELQYQWYLLTASVDIFKEDYVPVPGGTTKTLKIARAECETVFCGNLGCSGLIMYFVDVCNTFGCRRSEAIRPDILPPLVIPAGRKWNANLCKLVRKK